MKSALLLQVGASALLATAQPNVRRRHADLHHKRDAAIATEVVEVQVNANYIVNIKGDVTETIFVNQDIIGTKTSVISGQEAPSPAVANLEVIVPSSQATTTTAAAYSSVAPPPAPVQSATSPSPSPAGGDATKGYGSPSSGQNFGRGMVYSPYLPGGCRPDIAGDIKNLSRSWDVIRIYSVVDCHVLKYALEGVEGTNARILVSPTTGGTVAGANGCLEALVDVVDGRWQYIHSIGTSNERIMREGEGAIPAVIENLNKWKATYVAAGFKGPVVAIENSASWKKELAQASDYCAANIHAYYTPSAVAGKAADEVTAQMKAMIPECQGRTIVTESGWPSQGMDKASDENQAAAFTSLKGLSNIILFMAQNDATKKSDAAPWQQWLGFLE